MAGQEVYVSGRLRRSWIFGEGGEGRAVILAADHRYFGLWKGTENFGEVLPGLVPYADAFMTSDGVLRCYRGIRAAIKEKRTPVILRASGCTSIRNIPEDKDSMANERLIFSAKEADEREASAVAVSIYVGTRYQGQTLSNLREISRQGENTMPVLGVCAVGKELGGLSEDADYLAQAGTLAVEHGADFVKTYYPEEGFEKVLAVTPVPVVVAGGKMPEGLDCEGRARSSLEMAAKAVGKGARGIDFGRRVWTDKNPEAMIQALRAVVIGGMDVDNAVRRYAEISG